MKYATSYWPAARRHSEPTDDPPGLPAIRSSNPQRRSKQVNAVKINWREPSASHFQLSLPLSRATFAPLQSSCAPKADGRSPSPRGDWNRLGSGSRNLPEAKARRGPSERERASQRRGEGERNLFPPGIRILRAEATPAKPEIRSEMGSAPAPGALNHPVAAG